MKLKTHENVYYKGEGYISGYPLPCNDDRITVENHIFIHCDFHPQCIEKNFINCIFIDCEGVRYIREKLTGCTIHQSTD